MSDKGFKVKNGLTIEGTVNTLITADNSGGILIGGSPLVTGTPKGNTASRPASPTLGDIYSNTQTGYIEVYTAAGWSQLGVIPLSATIGTATDVGTNITYNSGAVDVAFTPAASGGLASSFTAVSSPGAISASGSSSPVRVTGLALGTSYTFTVTATNGYGNALASSSSSSATTTSVPQSPTIGTPTNITGVAFGSTTSASVPVTANATGGKAVSGFTVTSSPGSLNGSGTSPVTVAGLTSGTSYTFTAVATNPNGSSTSTSASSSLTPSTVPETPVAPTATNTSSGRAYNNGLASVAFTAPATGNSEITSYTVTSSPGSFTSTGASSPLTVSGLQSSTQYNYTVAATNANGTSIVSPASSGVTATTVPQAPTLGTVTITNSTTLSVPFTAGATGGSAITSYTATSSPSIALTVSGTTTPLTVTGTFASNQAYTVQIVAVNANGSSTASSASNSVTPIVIPTVTGGTLTSDATYYYRTFNSNGTLSVSNANLTADVLVIGGGGGGGWGEYRPFSPAQCTGTIHQYISAAGGGSGGLRYTSSSTFSPNSYAVVVGGGSSGGSTQTTPSAGSQSSINSLIGVGGNGGQHIDQGGNGGTSGSPSSKAGGAFGSQFSGSIPCYDNSTGDNFSTTNQRYYWGGGGGGSTGVGGTASGTGGTAGAGTAYFGTTYARGGAGAAGGTGASNTGNGGDGGSGEGVSQTGGNGGSGRVIVRYLKTAAL
jgi:hypothetical protein